MMTSRGLARVSPGLAFQNNILSRAPVRSIPRQGISRPSISSTRQFGTSLRCHGTSNIRNSTLASLSGRRIGAAGILSSQSILFSSRRFASTEPTTPPTNAAQSPGASELSSDGIGYNSFSDLDVDPNGVVDPASLLNIPERVGYLSELGLDYGWGPTSVCQWVMEHIHFDLGVPWWGAIIGVAVVTRLALFYPSLLGQQTSAKSQELNRDPIYKETMAKFMRSARGGGSSTSELMLLQNQLNYMKAQAGVKMWHMVLPLAQLPFALGMFKLTRAMADLPVPGLDTTGVLWMADLTVPDPLYILPCVSVALMYITMKATVPMMDPSQAAVGKILPWIIGPISIAVTIFMPATTQFYFAVAAILQWMQTNLFFIPAVRQAFGLPPLVRLDQQQPQPQQHGHYQAPRTIKTTAIERKPADEERKGPLETLRRAKEEMTESIRKVMGERNPSEPDAQDILQARRQQEAEMYRERVRKQLAKRQTKQR